MIQKQTKSNFMTVIAVFLVLYIFTPLGDAVNGFLANSGFTIEDGNQRGPLSEQSPEHDYSVQQVTTTPEYRISPTSIPVPTELPEIYEGTVPVSNPAPSMVDDALDGQRSAEPKPESSATLHPSHGDGSNKVLFWRDTNENCLFDPNEQSPNFMMSIVRNGAEQKVITDPSGTVWANDGDYISFMSNGFYVSSDVASSNLNVYSVFHVQGIYYVRLSEETTYSGKCP